MWWQGPAWGRRQTFKEKKRVGKKQKAQMDVLKEDWLSPLEIPTVY